MQAYTFILLIISLAYPRNRSFPARLNLLTIWFGRQKVSWYHTFCNSRLSVSLKRRLQSNTISAGEVYKSGKTAAGLYAKLQYRDLLWAGASFRSQEGFAGMVGLNISNTLTVGYAYDYTTSRPTNFSKGTYEVIVGFLIGNRYSDTCPGMFGDRY